MQKEITQNEENFIKIIDVFFGINGFFYAVKQSLRR